MKSGENKHKSKFDQQMKIWNNRNIHSVNKLSASYMSGAVLGAGNIVRRAIPALYDAQAALGGPRHINNRMLWWQLYWKHEWSVTGTQKEKK